MTPAEQRTVLVDLARAEARLAGLRLRVLAAADRNDIAADSAATSDRGLARPPDPADPRRRARRGQARPGVGHRVPGHPGRAGGRAGRRRPGDGDRPLGPRAARDVVGGWTGIGPSEHLVHAAGEFDHQALKVLGRRVFEVIDPEAADLAEGRRLEAEETAAARSTYLQLSANPDGTHTGRFKIPALHAAMLTKMLHAFTNPHQHAHRQHAPAQDQPTGRQGFAARAARRGVLPAPRTPPGRPAPADRRDVGHRGRAARLRPALTGLGTAVLDTGQPISAGLARQLACESGLVPAVWAPRPGIPVGGARPRAADPAAHRSPTHRPDHPGPGLHHPGLRPTRRLVPRPPRPTLGTRRTHQRGQRAAALRLPPRQGPLTPLRHHPPTHRTGPVPPTDVTGSSVAWTPTLVATGGA